MQSALLLRFTMFSCDPFLNACVIVLVAYILRSDSPSCWPDLDLLVTDPDPQPVISVMAVRIRLNLIIFENIVKGNYRYACGHITFFVFEVSSKVLWRPDSFS